MPPVIDQQVFTPINKDELKNSFHSSEEIDRVERYPYHFVAHLNDSFPAPLIWLSASQYDSISFAGKESLDDCLTLLPNRSYDSLLFLLTSYQSLKPNNFSKLLQPSFNLLTHDPVNQLLNKSYGYILYSFQLEQLYMMATGCNYMEAITFRKDWNRKTPAARNQAQTIILYNNISLAAIITDRSPDIHQFMFTPQLNAALRLWKYISLIE